MGRWFTRVLTITSLTCAIGAQAWAGIGDIDPQFGTAGGVAAFGATLLLPDDRLVFGNGGVGGFHTLLYDADGQLDPTYGNGNEIVAPLPAATPLFQAHYAAVTPDGGMLFAGIMDDASYTQTFEGLLRLDADGRLVTSFGGNGDGIYRLTSTSIRSHDGTVRSVLMGMAVDGTGRILLAERRWSIDGRSPSASALRRLTADGALDVTFGTNGYADVTGVDLSNKLALLGVRPDGRIVVGSGSGIVGLDENGARDAGFGEQGYSSQGVLRGWVLPDGTVVTVGYVPYYADLMLTGLDRSGRVGFNVGNLLGFGERAAWVSDTVLGPNAEYIDLQVHIDRSPGDGSRCNDAIVRLLPNGQLDLRFGRQGMTCLSYGTFAFALIATQSNGAPLFQELNGQLHRLLADDSPSPGLLTVDPYTAHLRAKEAGGTATLPVVRTAGHDGAVSVGIAVGPRHLDHVDDPSLFNATPGSDFVVPSGRLEWADGDTTPREIAVTIVDDSAVETVERFGLGIVGPEGGAQVIGSAAEVTIDDDDTSASPSNPPSGSNSNDSGGGGGSVTAATLLALCLLLLPRRRRKPSNCAGELEGVVPKRLDSGCESGVRTPPG